MKSEESFEFHIVRDTPSPSPPPPKAPSIPSVEEEPETEEEEPPEDEDVSFLPLLCGPFCQFYACVGVGNGNGNECTCIFILKSVYLKKIKTWYRTRVSYFFFCKSEMLSSWTVRVLQLYIQGLRIILTILLNFV